MIENIKALFNMPTALPQELVNHIIIYLRKSRKDTEFDKDEALEKTLERHETMLQNYSKNLFGCKIPENNIFREVVSGDTIADRPKMQEVLNTIELDSIKGVLCIEIERLARGNSIDQGIIAEKFLLTGTRILTPQKIFNLDDEFDMSYFEEGLHQSRKFLQYTKKILKRGREQSASEGKFTGSKSAFGYDKFKILKEKGYTLVKNSDNQTIRKLFECILYENLGTTNTAKKLNALGLKAPNNGDWNDNKVRRILQNADLYAGYILYNRRKTIKKYTNGIVITTRPLNKDCIRVKGKHEPTISEEELIMVKDKLKNMASKNVNSNNELKNPLANLVKCYFCGHNMSRRAYYTSCIKNGTLHKDTLLCRTLNSENVSSDLDVVESKILEFLRLKLIDYELYLSDYTANQENLVNDYEKEKIKLEKRIEDIKLQKVKAFDLLNTDMKDLVGEETFITRIENLNSELSSTEKLIKEINKKINLEKRDKYVNAVPILKNCLKMYNKATIEQKNQLLSSIIDVVIYKKTDKGGRWNKESRENFELEIRLKI